MNRVLFARHGQTDYNVEQRLQGWLDVPLNENGECQAGLLARRLSTFSIDAIYTSDLQRTLGTARVIADLHQPPLNPITMPGLREFNYGHWNGLTFSEIEERYPKEVAAWRGNIRDVGLPEGESIARFSQRVQKTLREILTRHNQHTLLIVTHGGVIRVLLCAALGLPPEDYAKFSSESTSLTEICYNQSSTRLSTINDTAHLQDWPYETGPHGSLQKFLLSGIKKEII